MMGLLIIFFNKRTNPLRQKENEKEQRLLQMWWANICLHVDTLEFQYIISFWIISFSREFYTMKKQSLYFSDFCLIIVLKKFCSVSPLMFLLSEFSLLNSWILLILAVLSPVFLIIQFEAKDFDKKDESVLHVNIHLIAVLDLLCLMKISLCLWRHNN